jgi:hypothetical protein
MNYILLTIIILTCSIFYYVFNRYNRRYYYKGYRTAYKYTSLISLPKERLSNVKVLLNDIFHDALGETINKIEANLSTIKKRIAEIEESISSSLKDKEIAEVNILKINEDNLDTSNYNQSRESTQKEINQLTSENKNLRNELSKSENIHIAGSPDDKKNGILKSNSWIEATSKKIIQLNKEFSSLWFFFILVALDYLLAVSFFKDIAGTGDKTIDFILGYLLPLAVTFISMLLIQMIKEGYKKIRSRNSDINNYIYLVLIFVLLFFIVGLVIFYRLNTSHTFDNFIIDSLLGALFISLVLVASHYVEKQGKDATFLIAAPINFLIFSVEFILISVFWIFENIYIIIKQNKDAVKSISRRNVKNIQREIKINQEALNEKKCLLREVEEKIEKHKNDYVNNLKKQLQIKIDFLGKDLSIKKREMSHLKKKEGSLNKFISDIREGSDDGVIAALSKKQF